MATIQITAALEGSSTFYARSNTVYPDDNSRIGILIRPFCHFHIERSDTFTAEDVGINVIPTRSNRYSVDDYIVVDGRLESAASYPETFRVKVGINGRQAVSEPMRTDPSVLAIKCSSRWVPKVGNVNYYESGIWRPFSGSEPLYLYSQDDGSQPTLLDNDMFVVPDRKNPGLLRSYNAVQFTGTDKLSTNTSNWGSSDVAAMIVMVPYRAFNRAKPVHIIGLQGNQIAGSVGLHVTLDSWGNIQLWSDESRNISPRATPADVHAVLPFQDSQNQVVIIGFRYNSVSQTLRLMACTPTVKTETEPVKWTTWNGTPAKERLISADLQLMYSDYEQYAEVLDLSFWLGKLNEADWEQTLRLYAQCYGVK